MRVECGSCKRLAEGQFQLLAGGGVAVTCTNCGATTAAELHDAPSQPSAAIPLDKLCPKCGLTRQPEAAACRGCGISTSRMASFAEERDAAVPDDVRAEWDAPRRVE